jgi:hypothetical protein
MTIFYSLMRMGIYMYISTIKECVKDYYFIFCHEWYHLKSLDPPFNTLKKFN